MDSAWWGSVLSFFDLGAYQYWRLSILTGMAWETQENVFLILGILFGYNNFNCTCIWNLNRVKLKIKILYEKYVLSKKTVLWDIKDRNFEEYECEKSIESKALKHDNLGKEAEREKVFDFVLKFLYWMSSYKKKIVYK